MLGSYQGLVTSAVALFCFADDLIGFSEDCKGSNLAASVSCGPFFLGVLVI